MFYTLAVFFDNTRFLPNFAHIAFPATCGKISVVRISPEVMSLIYIESQVLVEIQNRPKIKRVILINKSNKLIDIKK